MSIGAKRGEALRSGPRGWSGAICFTGPSVSTRTDEQLKLSLPPPTTTTGSWRARRAALDAHLAPVEQGAAVFTRPKVCWRFHSDLSVTVL